MEYSLRNTESFRGKRQMEKMKNFLEVGKVYKVKTKKITGKKVEWSREPMILVGLFEHFASFSAVKGGYRTSENYLDLYAQRGTLV